MAPLNNSGSCTLKARAEAEAEAEAEAAFRRLDVKPMHAAVRAAEAIRAAKAFRQEEGQELGTKKGQTLSVVTSG